MPAAVECYVRRSVATAGPGAFLFPSLAGGIWTNTNFRVRCRWTEVTTAVGLPGTTIHDLRHTAASLLIAAGADVKAVQVILGHATATMAMDLYGHLSSDAPWVGMERLPSFPELPTWSAIGSAPAEPPGIEMARPAASDLRRS